MNMKTVSALLFTSLMALPFHAKASFQSEDMLSIEEEFAYRQKIEADAAKWAEDLMYVYRESPNSARRRDPSRRSLSSGLAWMSLTGRGALATFDFKHADQTLLGSTSRLVLSLKRSKRFWLEVRNQCLEIESLKQAKNKSLGLPNVSEPGWLRACADRLDRDMEISQVIGSNASVVATILVGGGVGTVLYRRYAGQWVATRIVPLIPAFARSKYMAAGLGLALVVLPPAVIVASISTEHQTQKEFLENLETSLEASVAESETESVLRQKALKQERQVIEFAMWIGQRLPKNLSESESADFLFSMRLSAPHFQDIKTEAVELERRRAQIESELQAIPGVSEKLQALVETRKTSKLSGDEAALFRKAQYLAALRLALRAVSADLQSSPSVD